MTGTTARTGRTPDDIAALLEDELVSGRLAPGTRLPSERLLAQRMGVGRPLVREALRTLVERGLLEVSPGRGTFVREVAAADVARPMAVVYRRRNATTRDLVQARMMLECEAAAIAAERATGEDVAELEAALQRLEAAGDVVERSRLDLAFHRRISEAAQNPVIDTMFASIGTLVFEHMLRSHNERLIAETAHPYHREALQAIRDHDPEAARRAMADHLRVATEHYGPDLDLGIEHLARRELARLHDSRGFDALRMQLEDLLKVDAAGLRASEASRP